MNKNIIILILSHGKLAQEIYNTAKMIVGNIKDIYYFNFLKSMSYQDLEKKVKNFVKKRNNSEILIFTDLFGGSCLNACSNIIKQNKIRIFSGINLGLLLEAIFLRNSYDLKNLAAALDEKKNNTIVYVNKEKFH